MGHWKQLFSGSDYLAAAEFGDRVFTAKIARVEAVVIEEDNGKQKRKGVVHFEGHQKGWMLCKTNAICLGAMFGDEYAAWTGKSVTLYATMVKVGKGQELGIRVKGSPDLTATVEAEIKLPRRRPFKLKLVPTGKKTNGAAKPAETLPETTTAEETAEVLEQAQQHDEADVTF